jgi:hypothetical protein
MSKAMQSSLAALMVLFLLVLPSHAQQTLGSVIGTVKDSSGGMVSKVAVKVRNLATNLTQTASTKDDGSFNIADLPVGTYEVTFTRDGFKTQVYSQILVQADRTTTLNSSLQPGEVNTQITVSGTPLLNQVDTTNGYVMGSELIESIPLGTGSFTQLAILAPGVSADLLATSGTNAGLGNQSIWANGQRDTSNSLSLNGVSSDNIFNGKTSSQVASNRVLFNVGEGGSNQIDGEIQTSTSVYAAIGQSIPTPPQETIEELRVNTSMYDASEGANSGAHIALLTKSGTNELHGQVYEYYQTDAWNAAPFFRNADPTLPTSQKVPKLHRNQFGGTLGGPIKKDKLFFFGSYQGVRVSDQLGGNSNVTVPLFLTDDRSDAGIIAAMNKSFPCGGTTGVTCITQVDPVARKLLNAKAKNGTLLIPSPPPISVTCPSFPDTSTNCPAVSQSHDAVIIGPPSRFQADQYNANIDYNFSQKDRLAAKYYYQSDPGTNPFAESQLLDAPQELTAGSQVLSLGNSTFLTPNLSWQQKFGFIREVAFASTKQALTPADAGINVLNNTLFPVINIFNADPNVRQAFAVGPSNNFANAGIFQNQFGGSSGVGWVHGRHTFSFGGSFERTQLNVINKNNQLSFVDFADFPSFVSGVLATGPGNSTFFNGASNRYYRANQIGAYADDKIKLRQNLSLSLGFRYDFDGPLVEKNGLLTNFVPSLYKYDFNTDTVVNTGLVVAGNNKAFGTKGVSDSTLRYRQQAFEPRIGIVWSPSFIKNFVVRAGFGIYADRGEFFTELSPSAGADFNGPFGVTLAQPFTLRVFSAPGATFSAPFGTTPPPPPPASLNQVNSQVLNRPTLANGNAPFVFGGYDVNNKLPYSENWTIDLQWQPVNTVALTLAYVGNHGVHGTIPIPFNQPRIATTQNPLQGQTFSYGYVTPGLPQEDPALGQGGVSTFDGGNIDFRTPFIGYGASSMLYEAAGNSNYHALQFGVNKRMSHGLLINGSYTWSHSLDMQSGLGLFFTGNDPLNLKSAYGNSDFDRTHVLTISYLYELPKLVRREGIASKFINGWGFGGITVLESGQPYSVSDFSGAVAGIYFNNFDSITNPIVSFAPGQNVRTAQIQGTTGVNAGKPVLNPAAFTFPFLPPGTSGVPPCFNPGAGAAPICDNFETGFGNVGRNTFRGPFQTRFDFSVNKQTKLTERFSLKYTAQIFNIFNHPSFDTPNNNVFFNQNFNSSQPPILIPGAPPGGSLGLIQHTIGSPRFIQMALHLTF